MNSISRFLRAAARVGVALPCVLFAQQPGVAALQGWTVEKRLLRAFSITLGRAMVGYGRLCRGMGV